MFREALQPIPVWRRRTSGCREVVVKTLKYQSGSVMHTIGKSASSMQPDVFLDLFAKPEDSHHPVASGETMFREPKEPRIAFEGGAGVAKYTSSLTKDLSPLSATCGGTRRSRSDTDMRLHQRWLLWRKYCCPREPPNICKWATTTLFGRLSRLLLIFWTLVLAYSIFTYSFMAAEMARVDNMTEEVMQATLGEYRFRHTQIASIHLVEPTL
mmetsp:Transcript_46134/g.114726  ORF Transcript_46134/g.114726 Transcript_46134/m.114726 type:complete len:212 (-) Transcript_46134:1427-2062(-)